MKYFRELRDFCGFDVVPDASKFTRFKQDFLPDLQSMFSRLVDLTEPICPKMKWEYNKETGKSRRVCHWGLPYFSYVRA